ncbi:MAG: GTPase HflX [Thermodesulfobacteriota bacterium]
MYRLRGYRIISTSNKDNHTFSNNDLTTLLNERLDLIVFLRNMDGNPGPIDIAYIVPPNQDDRKWNIEHYNNTGQIDLNFEYLISDIERNLENSYIENGGDKQKEGVYLVGFSTHYKYLSEISLDELRSLAYSANKAVLGKTLQTRRKPDPRYLIGKGKLNEIFLNANHLGADTIIFDVELTPAQIKSISNQTELNIIDRTQLILEIFAKRATTSEGKIQVKLAQLKYALPRLTGKGIEMSQLGGGIGTRGPGEKKIEHQKRRLRKQIDIYENQIKKLANRRESSRKQRARTGILTATFIGYTNVGKSTLFNQLTKSNVATQNKLFSTLNPTTRKLFLKIGKEILLTDTVGFISDLPRDLVNAFRATIEELGDSDLLIHIADGSDPLFEERIESVEKIIEEIGYGNIPRFIIFNKVDLIDEELKERLERMYNTRVISAFDNGSLKEFREVLDKKIDELIESQVKSKIIYALN